MTNNNLLPTKLMYYQEKVMRISKMITLKRNALIIYQILSTNALTKCMEISLENLYLKIILSFKGPPLHQERSQRHGKPGQARPWAGLPGKCGLEKSGKPVQAQGFEVSLAIEVWLFRPH